ncbi:cytochrome c [Inquilinus sp. CAU 1745]|uniref:cytochrome c n=1 Tax=Inquilinus sp. CAU 1745 TaxID=3140369 RepID=UPI00325BE228
MALSRAMIPAASLLFLAGGAAWAQEVELDPASDDPVARGAYIFAAAGCAACHTAEEEGARPLAGGRALSTPFGTFYSPNITPDPEHGIGDWTEADLVRALRGGVSPSGDPYYPAFPYTSYTGMTATDIADLWAYLRSVPPAAVENRPHDLSWPFSWRFLLPVWRSMNFERIPPEAAAVRAEQSRGAYLVEALGHCAQCHTPRGPLGGLDEDLHLAGAEDGPGGEVVPNITPHEETGIGGWSADDLTFFLEIGMMPDGDFAGGEMADVISETTSRLTTEDRAAMVEYLRNLPPIEHAVGGE